MGFAEHFGQSHDIDDKSMPAARFSNFLPRGQQIKQKLFFFLDDMVDNQQGPLMGYEYIQILPITNIFYNN